MKESDVEQLIESNPATIVDDPYLNLIANTSPNVLDRAVRNESHAYNDLVYRLAFHGKALDSA